MKRLQLFEIEDSPHLPAFIRDMVTDYLQFIVRFLKPYRPVLPALADVIRQQKIDTIIDYGSGAAGPMVDVARSLKLDFDLDLRLILTDKFPNFSAKQELRTEARNFGLKLEYLLQPVDVARQLPEIEGLHTFFNVFHHFTPVQAIGILQKIAERQQPVGIFELTGRHPWTLFTIFVSPVYVWLLTPFIKPFRWRRLFFTYPLPVVPFIVWWDGMVSNFRTYSIPEMKELIKNAGISHYHWEMGEIRSILNIRVKYVLGSPLLGGV